MAKYIDADLLRKEIEKKSYEEQGFSSGDSEYGYRSCARDLLAFIDTLSEEPDKRLDEAAHRYAWKKQEHHIDFDGEEYLDYGPRYDAFKAGAEWLAGKFQKIEGDLVDWYSTSDGKDYCCGVKTDEAFEIPEGFYIRKKQ